MSSLEIITLRYGVINHKFNVRVFDFKLIHPIIWLQIDWSSKQLQINFINFFGEVTLLEWVWAGSVLRPTLIDLHQIQFIVLLYSQEENLNC